ncbi:alpha/beta hydrolase fold domain-containing protein [Arcanobacterium ihumii]|uniref:alpha/beta hydrolase fold domain-containing protein n=1 Tax=Arcanobacterium ihumii TaxID=2138162 RepID=UPI000F535C77|nr:alpha/beta hydrolase fold domain-containing protein [Arcanobacterium ihumii]
MSKIHVPDFWSENQNQVWLKQEEIRKQLNLPRETLAEVRYGYRKKREYWNAGGPLMATKNFSFSTKYGEIPARLYASPTSYSNRDQEKVIVYAHGGGWIVGDLDTHDRLCRELAESCSCAVLAIDYTLSPEAKYPQALEEFIAAIAWAQERFKEVWLGGDSAGATLSLGASAWIRDSQGKITDLALGQVEGLLLFYGGYGLKDSQSRATLGGYWDGMDDEDSASYEGAYLMEGQVAPYHYLLENDLSGLPKSYILATEFDPLRDDSRALYHAMGGAESASKYVEVPGVIHTFLQYVRMLPEAERIFTDVGEFVNSA